MAIITALETNREPLNTLDRESKLLQIKLNLVFFQFHRHDPFFIIADLEFTEKFLRYLVAWLSVLGL